MKKIFELNKIMNKVEEEAACREMQKKQQLEDMLAGVVKNMED
jgi:hypothetical protein